MTHPVEFTFLAAAIVLGALSVAHQYWKLRKRGKK